MSVELENDLLDWTTPNRSERLPVQGRGTIFLQRREMLRRAIALMRSQAVLGEDRIPLAHHAVALHLGENRSRRDRSGKRITMNDGLLGKRTIQANGIDQKMVRSRLKPHHRLAHRDARCLINIDLVDA